ncbi:MAG: DUF427 domain-containing protein [Cyanobacteria bacterium J06632_22]
MTRRIEPGPGQESVWDYPRPPALEPVSERIRVVLGTITLADTVRSQRVLETSHPPVYYIPPADIQMQYLQQTAKASFCEWKGMAKYYTVQVGDHAVVDAAWAYGEPTSRFVDIADYIAFYPSKMSACYVDEEQVQSQVGDFYGGWITSKIVGPFKGGVGTWGW